MTREQAIEGNKVIGRFMGYKMTPGGFGSKNKRTIDFNELTHSGCPSFHDEFSWLMRVWEEISRIRDLNNSDEANMYIDDMSISSHSSSIKAYGKTVQDKFIGFEVIQDWGIGNEHLTNKNLLDCVFKVCVEFIKWYETQ